MPKNMRLVQLVSHTWQLAVALQEPPMVLLDFPLMHWEFPIPPSQGAQAVTQLVLAVELFMPQADRTVLHSQAPHEGRDQLEPLTAPQRPIQKVHVHNLVITNWNVLCFTVHCLIHGAK